VGDWLRTYGWKFALALIVAAVALAYLIHADRKAHGEGAVRRAAPLVALVAPAAGRSHVRFPGPTRETGRPTPARA
jgi:hypothetical protein